MTARQQQRPAITSGTWSADMAATIARAIRIPDEVWHAAVAKARNEGTTVTAVVTAALHKYLRTPAKSQR